MKPMTVKLGRRSFGSYEIGGRKSKFSMEYGFPLDRGYMEGFCSKKFERITGFKLKLGESCLVQFHVKKVKK